MLALLIVYAVSLSVSVFLAFVLVQALRTPPSDKTYHPIVSVRYHKKRTFGDIGNSLKMLMFGWEFPPHNSGGLGVACKGIVDGLTKEGTSITFVLPKSVPQTGAVPFLSAGVESTTVIDSPLSPYLSTASYATLPNGSPVYGSSLKEEVMRYAVSGGALAKTAPHDVIYAHDWLSFPAGIEAKRLSGKPLITHVHATEFDRTGENRADPVIYEIEKAGLDASDRVIAVSNRTKQTLIDKYQIPEEKISVVHNGIDEQTAPQGVSKGRWHALKKQGHSIVLFMGRLTLQKGPDHFLEACALLLKKNPRVTIVLAGSGDMEQSLIEQAARLGISAHVLFPGFLRGDDQYEAYKEADLFVMPSVSEPYGIAALEAMHLQTPVLVSKQSGVVEAIPQLQSVDFWNHAEMANRMEDILTHKDTALIRAREAKLALRAHSWSAKAKEIQEIARELTKHPRLVAPH
jgi:glycogen(starch) synthase